MPNPPQNKYYSIKLLQKILDLLWKHATQEGYVLYAPSLLLGTGKRMTITITKSETIVVNVSELIAICRTLGKVGAAELHAYKSTHTKIPIVQVVQNKIDPAKHAAVYEAHEVSKLQRTVEELEDKLAATRAQLECRTTTSTTVNAQSPSSG